MLQTELYNFYQMDQYQTQHDLFASQEERNPMNYRRRKHEKAKMLASPHLHILLPSHKAWTNSYNYQHQVPSNKVFNTWLDRFDQKMAHKVEDVKPMFYVPRTVKGVTRLEILKDGKEEGQSYENTLPNGRKSDTRYVKEYDDSMSDDKHSDYGENTVPQDTGSSRYQGKYNSSSRKKYGKERSKIGKHDRHANIKPIISSRYNQEGKRKKGTSSKTGGWRQRHRAKPCTSIPKPGSRSHAQDIHIGDTNRQGWRPVSYTHLTLPTILLV